MAPGAFSIFCAQSDDAIDALVGRIADYQPLGGVDRARVTGWLRQFQGQHRRLALRLGDALHYYGTHQINGLMTAMKSNIDAQIAQTTVAPTGAFYVPLGRTAESGQDIVRRFRNVNNLHDHRSQFVEAIELPKIVYKNEEIALFFLDDFIGTGRQVTNHWREVLSELVPEYVPMYVAVVAAFEDGMNRVEQETPLRILTVHTLTSMHQLLGSGNRSLSSGDKTTLRRYCERIGNHPLGFGELGALVSFTHGTPNNAPSIIRGSKGQRQWSGLLPGWEDLR